MKKEVEKKKKEKKKEETDDEEGKRGGKLLRYRDKTEETLEQLVGQPSTQPPHLFFPPSFRISQKKTKQNKKS